MKWVPVMAGVVTLAWAGMATAQTASALVAQNDEQKCAWQETTTLGLSYSSYSDSASEVLTKLEQTRKDVDALAKKHKLDTFELQNENYSVNSQSGSQQGYRYNLSLSYQTDNAEKATRLLEDITKELRMSGNVNARKYKNPSCMRR